MHRIDKKNMIIIAIIILILIGAILATVMIVVNNEGMDKVEKNSEPKDNSNEKEEDDEEEEKEKEEEEDEISGNINSFAVQIFNSQFTIYEGEIRGVQFESLINTAISSNEANPEHQVNPTTNNLESFANIDKTAIYVVTLSYDDDGYVNSINIDLKEENETSNTENSILNNTEQMAMQTFNKQFTVFEGDSSASQIRALLGAVSASNTANQEHQVEVNITKEDINYNYDYRVETSLGNDGYVNNIKVTKIEQEAN